MGGTWGGTWVTRRAVRAARGMDRGRGRSKKKGTKGKGGGGERGSGGGGGAAGRGRGRGRHGRRRKAADQGSSAAGSAVGGAGAGRTPGSGSGRGGSASGSGRTPGSGRGRGRRRRAAAQAAAGATPSSAARGGDAAGTSAGGSRANASEQHAASKPSASGPPVSAAASSAPVAAAAASAPRAAVRKHSIEVGSAQDSAAPKRRRLSPKTPTISCQPPPTGVDAQPSQSAAENGITSPGSPATHAVALGAPAAPQSSTSASERVISVSGGTRSAGGASFARAVSANGVVATTLPADSVASVAAPATATPSTSAAPTAVSQVAAGMTAERRAGPTRSPAVVSTPAPTSSPVATPAIKRQLASPTSGASGVGTPPLKRRVGTPPPTLGHAGAIHDQVSATDGERHSASGAGGSAGEPTERRLDRSLATDTNTLASPSQPTSASADVGARPQAHAAARAWGATFGIRPPAHQSSETSVEALLKPQPLNSWYLTRGPPSFARARPRGFASSAAKHLSQRVPARANMFTRTLPAATRTPRARVGVGPRNGTAVKTPAAAAARRVQAGSAPARVGANGAPDAAAQLPGSERIAFLSSAQWHQWFADRDTSEIDITEGGVDATLVDKPPVPLRENEKAAKTVESPVTTAERRAEGPATQNPLLARLRAELSGEREASRSFERSLIGGIRSGMSLSTPDPGIRVQNDSSEADADSAGTSCRRAIAQRSDAPPSRGGGGGAGAGAGRGPR